MRGRGEDEGGDECAVCLEEVDDRRCVLACGHVFHSSCILQSALHDARCPVCRVELAKPPPPPPTPSSSRVLSLELAIDAVQDRVEEQVRAVRRGQANYDARRRRFLRRRPDLLREEAALRSGRVELRALERKMEADWARETSALWVGPAFAPAKRQRALLLRRVRRRERVVDGAVTEELGERPELSEEEEDDDEGEEGEEVVEAGGEEGALWRAIARLGESIRR